MAYFAFGETFVEEHKNSHNSPYKFNGKELDEETGNYYYGARYYNPRTSIWLSVDPLAEQFPSWSPYNYTFNNPIRYTDPDGMAPEDVIFLIDKEGAGGRGHMAMLYQDGNGDWNYYSQGALSNPDFSDFAKILKTDLKSGHLNYGENGSHKEMNKDVGNGANYIYRKAAKKALGNGEVNWFTRAAEATATKATIQYNNQVENKIKE